MNKIILFLCLMFICSSVFATDYVYINDNPLEVRKLPLKWTFKDGSKTGNFNLIPLSMLLGEGWRPVTVKNNENYDTAIQTRTLDPANIVIFADHAEITYTVTNKGLNAYKKQKGREIRAEGFTVLGDKYNDNMEDGYDADFATLKAYYKNTIVPLVTNATTLQEIKNINNGDEYTWPAI